MVSAIVADQVGLLWGVQHTHYVISSIPHVSAWALVAMVIAGAVFGLTGKVFADATHALSAWMKKQISYGPLRPLVGVYSSEYEQPARRHEHPSRCS